MIDPNVQNHAAIRTFVLETSDGMRPKGLRSIAYTLAHIGPDGTREPVRTDAIAESIAAVEKIPTEKRELAADRIAQRFVEAAQTLTDQHYPRPQQFFIAASASTEPDVAPIDQLPLRLAPSPDAAKAYADVSSEPATEKGALALMMRWGEVHAKTMQDGVKSARDDSQKTADRMERILEKTLERNGILETRLLELSVALQDSLDRGTTRAMDAYAKRIEVDREERMWRALEAAMPKLLDKWAAGPLTNFVKTLKPDQIKVLIASCPPEQRPLLLEALDVHLGLKLLERPDPSNGLAKTEPDEVTS